MNPTAHIYYTYKGFGTWRILCAACVKLRRLDLWDCKSLGAAEQGCDDCNLREQGVVPQGTGSKLLPVAGLA